MVTTLFLLFSSFFVQACDQIVYDDIYKAIVQKAIVTPGDQRKRVFGPEIQFPLPDSVITNRERNIAIRKLRDLCEGQLSSYEKGLDIKTRTQKNKSLTTIRRSKNYVNKN